MNTQSVNQCPKVWKRVQLCLEASPVISRFPILQQGLCLSEGNSLGPVLYWLFVGKSDSSQARAKIVHGLLRNRNMKQTDLFASFGYQRFKCLGHSCVSSVEGSGCCRPHNRLRPVRF